MVRVCRVEDGASPGKKPVQTLVEKVILPYEEQRLGIRRYYAAKEAMADAERVIRVPDPGEITVSDAGKIFYTARVNTQDRAVTEDGTQYGIEMVQLVPGVYPRCLDLTLKRVEPSLEVVSYPVD